MSRIKAYAGAAGGWDALGRSPVALLVTSRASYEVHKAAQAGIGHVAAL